MGNPLSSRLDTLSIGKEATWGVQAATQLEQIPHTGFDANVTYNFIDTAERTGSRVASPAGPILTSSNGNLKIPFILNKKTIGWFLKSTLGYEATVTGSGPYTHTFTPLGNNNILPSYTFQVGKGGYESYYCLGGVADSLSLDFSQRAELKGECDFVYQSEVSTGLSYSLAGATAFNTSTGAITLANTFIAGQTVRFFAESGITLPTGINAGQTYYVVSPTTSLFYISATPGGSVLIPSAVGSGNAKMYLGEMTTAPTDRRLTFKDALSGSILINGATFGELQSGSLNFKNNLNSGDYRLGNAGLLNSIVAGKFESTGKFTVVYNALSASLRSALTGNTPVALTIKFNEDANNYVQFYFPAVVLKGGAKDNSEDGIKQTFDFVGTTLAPVTATLVNGYSGTY